MNANPEIELKVHLTFGEAKRAFAWGVLGGAGLIGTVVALARGYALDWPGLLSELALLLGVVWFVGLTHRFGVEELDEAPTHPAVFATGFEVEVDLDDDGRWRAEVPALPGIVAYGASPEEAHARARHIVEEAKQQAQRELAAQGGNE